MERDLEELRQHLIVTNEEFSRLAKEHSEHKLRLEQLYQRPHLTDADRIEEINLKKRKLVLKDQMERIIQKYRNVVA